MKKAGVFFIVVAFFILVFTGCGKMMNKIEETRVMEITDIDLTKIADGTYQGAHPVGPMKYVVEVTVSDHKIASIDIVEAFSGNEYSQKGQAILDSVVAYQSLEVDVITGSTVTSKAYLAAIEDALRKGLKD
ncbi:FMN-binding protein [candidate division WOR-3 bacterium]|nr:FMN-binding protein [candidate division WOR-3 bacterium]